MMTKKKNGKRKQFSKMGKRSAQKLGKAGRVLRARHAALTRHLSDAERARDEGEARQTIGDVRASMLWDARQLVTANPDVPVGKLATDLQSRWKFYLTTATARSLVEQAALALARGIVIPNPNPSPRFLATHVVLKPRDERPEVKRGKKD